MRRQTRMAAYVLAVTLVLSGLALARDDDDYGRGWGNSDKRINTDTTMDTAMACGMDARRPARTILPISVRAIMTAQPTVTRAGWDRKTVPRWVP